MCGKISSKSKFAKFSLAVVVELLLLNFSLATFKAVSCTSLNTLPCFDWYWSLSNAQFVYPSSDSLGRWLFGFEFSWCGTSWTGFGVGVILFFLFFLLKIWISHVFSISPKLAILEKNSKHENKIHFVFRVESTERVRDTFVRWTADSNWLAESHSLMFFITDWAPLPFVRFVFIICSIKIGRLSALPTTIGKTWRRRQLQSR